MKVQIHLHAANMLKNLRYAFSNRYTVVSELMQNARRAGARSIQIDYDARTQVLVVRDDGSGITDFQTLFSIGESGWDGSIAEAEHAFGLGFMKCLYSASHCSVYSCGRSVSFESQTALARKSIEVVEAAIAVGTVVTLHGVSLPELDAKIKTLAQGFPVRIIYNGRAIARPFAADQRAMIATEIGAVDVKGLADGQASTDTLVFLQGFLLYGDDDPGLGNGNNVVHLDSSQFVARLPDRDKLIDEEDQLKRVDQCLRVLWRQRLLHAKLDLSPAAFAEHFFDAANRWGLLDVLDDVPALPRRLFRSVVAYPYQDGYLERDYVEVVERTVLREDLERGVLKLVTLDSITEENIPLWMYARARGLIIFEDCGLSEQHWIHQHVRPLDEEMFGVEVIEASDRTEFEGVWVWSSVVLCKAYAITVSADRIVIQDEAMFWHDRDEVLVPDNETTGRVVRQVSSFIDGDDHYHDEDIGRDENAFVDQVRLMRAKDPQCALQSLIAELKLEKYPCLRGKTFTLEVAPNSSDHRVALAL